MLIRIGDATISTDHVALISHGHRRIKPRSALEGGPHEIEYGLNLHLIGGQTVDVFGDDLPPVCRALGINPAELDLPAAHEVAPVKT